MNDERKEAMDQLIAMDADLIDPVQDRLVLAVRELAADRIEAQAAEIKRLREALREVFEQWAGSEGFIPETAPEGYLLELTKRMALTARAALGDTQ
jgi:predicted type IV restriction endonuclease